MIFKRAAFLGDKKEIENEIIKKKKKKKHTPMFVFLNHRFLSGIISLVIGRPDRPTTWRLMEFFQKKKKFKIK